MTDSLKTQDSRFAGSIGKDYDAIARLISPYLDQIQQSVADAIVPLRKKVHHRKLRVLDLGCGDGLTTKAILRTISEVDLVALDSEPVMIQKFRDNLNSSDAGSTITLVEDDALSFLQKCEIESFDAIGSCFALHNCADDYRRKVIKEIYRVLKHPGIFANADKLAQPEPLHSQAFSKRIMLIIDTFAAAGRPDLLREWVAHYLEDNIPGRRWSESDAELDLQLAGFTRVQNTLRYDLEATLVAVKDEAEAARS